MDKDSHCRRLSRHAAARRCLLSLVVVAHAADDSVCAPWRLSQQVSRVAEVLPNIR